MYCLAMEFAKDEAGKALTEPSKSIDIVQAFLLLAVYPEPKRKWTEDRSWLFMGVAFRCAPTRPFSRLFSSYPLGQNGNRDWPQSTVARWLQRARESKQDKDLAQLLLCRRIVCDTIWQDAYDTPQ
jgi:hypothetical protein